MRIRLLLALVSATTACAVSHRATPASPTARSACRASPDWDYERWHPVEDGHRFVERGDWDGDGEQDSLLAIRHGGSGGAGVDITLALSGSAKPIAVTTWTSFYSMVTRHEVPRALRSPQRAEARAAVERVLFPRVCPAPDPSLRLLLSRAAGWRAGATPELPENYALKRGDQWIEYLGSNHQRGTQPRLAARRGGQSLWLTAHGAYLVDETDRRHRWLYVFPGGDSHKLRWPSMIGGRLEDGAAVLTVDPFGPGAHTVRIVL